MPIPYIPCPAHIDGRNHWMHHRAVICKKDYEWLKKAFPHLKKLVWDDNPRTILSSRKKVVEWLIAERLWRKKVDELKAAVVKILVTEFDFTTEDAEEKVDESFRNDKDMWNENAEPKDLAEYLANDDDDE